MIDGIGGLLLVIGIAGAAMLWPRRADATADATAINTGWQLPASAAPYAVTIRAAEIRHGMPPGLLGRLLYQESRFRPDIIDGTTKSSAGAVGIAQIVPRWHPDVNPLDPYASIGYAAQYLANMRQKFGTWQLALAAYNWGPGNLGNDTGGTTWPTETRNYVAQITADVGQGVLS